VSVNQNIVNCKECKSASLCFQYLSRQDIADFASVSTESAIKFTKEFEKGGILKLEGKEIKIVDKDKMMEIAERG